MGLAWTFKGHTHPSYMVDTNLKFGSRLAPGIFHCLTQFVHRIMARWGYNVVAYLDDFFIHESTFEKCMSAVHVLIQLLRDLGFSISYEKFEGPATWVTFLSIVVDSVVFTLELPRQKLNEFYAILLQFAACKRASLRQFQQLAGRLHWTCQVVRGGRCYLRRILDVIKPLKLAHHKVVLSESFYADIDWWLQFLPVFNGKCLALNLASVHDVFVDASGSGSGFVFDTDWGYWEWRDIEHTVNQFQISEKEILSAVFAVRRWAPRWANSRVLFHTDNVTAWAALRTGSVKSPLMMPYLHELFWLAALFKFAVDAGHIPGHQNDTPVTISRLEQPDYHSLMPLVYPWVLGCMYYIVSLCMYLIIRYVPFCPWFGSTAFAIPAGQLCDQIQGFMLRGFDQGFLSHSQEGLFPPTPPPPTPSSHERSFLISWLFLPGYADCNTVPTWWM